MKYKHITAAIHNFGHGFCSLVNYVDDGYVIDELSAIHGKGYDIEIDWLAGEFKPATLLTPRLAKSIARWRAGLAEHLQRHRVDPAALESLKLIWPARQRKHMLALDDRGQAHKIDVNEVS